MATTELVPVKRLIIDLKNFRTVQQDNELDAIHALVTIAPDKFWALMDSLIDSGYFLTENILVLQSGNKMHVREGNRRVGALKIILGLVTVPNLTIPSEIESKISALTKEWKTTNSKVPCAVYDAGEIKSAGRIVSLTHGKSEPAGRAQWNAVARARHNQSEGASEPGLDLLEKYLVNGKNLTPEEAELWAGEYHLTVLEEALQTVSPRLGFATIRDLTNAYPALPKQRNALDSILCDIGRKTLDFPVIRNRADDFAQTRYGILPLPAQASGTAVSGAHSPNTTGTGQTAAVGGTASATTTTPAKKTRAVAVNDTRAAVRTLRQFHPKGKNREKLVTLLIEARGLKLKAHPHSFCFLLRSMFELSAKAYCQDHAGTGGPAVTKPTGEDRHLVDVLNDVTVHLTKNKTDKAMLKRLHGAMAELKKTHGFLSVTSLNQLIHNPKFIVDETHICNLFFNIFPLLEEMNN
jgi:hypothetical protein